MDQIALALRNAQYNEEQRVLVQVANQAKEAAEAANKAKTAFLANISHELRTPLNAIIGYSEILQDDALEIDQPEFTDDLNRISDAGEHLLTMINTILDYTTIEAGKLGVETKRFAVQSLINSIVSIIQPKIDQDGNELRVIADSRLGEMETDPIRLQQILLNLLSNATKFTSNGLITFRIIRTKKANKDWIRFIVQDTGIGIADEDKPLLFKMFSQIDDSSTRKYGGAGIGLAISRRLCEMLGGTISVNSSVNEGSTFIVETPATFQFPATATTPAVMVASPPPVSIPISIPDEVIPDNHTVLVIDDNPAVRDLISRYLERAGFTVHTASSGQEGIELATTLHPDAITLDVLMPEMSGWDTLAQLKEIPHLDNMPIILFSVLAEREKGIALGATDQLLKPKDYAIIAPTIARYIQISSSAKILRQK